MTEKTGAREFGAPWSNAVVTWSLAVVGICVFVAYQLWRTLGHQDFSSVAAWTGVLPFLVLGYLGLSAIRGYVVTPEGIVVKRIARVTRLPFDGLETCEFDPQALKGARRVVGNGGVFGLTGRFRSPRLGSYTALLTDPDLAVILRYAKRTVVVSPHDPEGFVDAVRSSRNA